MGRDDGAGEAGALGTAAAARRAGRVRGDGGAAGRPARRSVVLLLCTAKHADQRLERTGPNGRWIGTHSLAADELLGPYRSPTDEPLVGDGPGTYDAGRIVDDPDGRPVFLVWRQWSAEGSFLGGLSDPAPVRVHADGRLEVDQAMLWPRG